MSATPSSDGNDSSLSVAMGPGNQFIMVMPFPGTPGTPFFDGRNVTEFLDRFSDLCTDYKLSDAEKMRRLPRYCDMRIGQSSETIQEWRERNWEKFWMLLREEFESADQVQIYHSREFLKTFKDRTRSEEEDPRCFCRHYARISKELSKRSQLDNYTRIQWFVQGLPGLIRKELLLHTGLDLDLDDLAKIDFDALLKKALQIAKRSRRLRKVTSNPFKLERLSHLAELCDSKPRWNSQAGDDDFFMPPIVAVAHTVIAPTPENLQAQTKKVQEDSMAFLTKKLDALALSLQAEVARAVRAVHVSSTQVQQQGTYQPMGEASNQPSLDPAWRDECDG